MTLQQPLVSVVTPVYNGERHLAECIESVLAQTYQNWQYVIVNNQSKDRTLEIAQSYAERDSRIHVHSNADFLPIIKNWNHALRQISPESKYTKVLHADDRMFPPCLEKMVQAAEQHPTVGLVGAYRQHGDRIDLNNLPRPRIFFTGREICRAALMKRLHVFGSPSNLLVRSDLVRKADAFYNELNLYADTEACYAILSRHDFGYVHEVLTFTRLHEGSMTSTLKRYHTRLIDKLDLLIKYGPEFLEEDEVNRILRARTNRYYRILAGNVVRHRDRTILEYHRTRLRQLGYRFEMHRFLNAAASQLARKALSRVVPAPLKGKGALRRPRQGPSQPA